MHTEDNFLNIILPYKRLKSISIVETISKDSNKIDLCQKV